MFADSTKIRAALQLEIVTIVWMVIEAAVAIGARKGHQEKNAASRQN